MRKILCEEETAGSVCGGCGFTIASDNALEGFRIKCGKRGAPCFHYTVVFYQQACHHYSYWDKEGKGA